ncbi:MAG: diguanylate cyclase [Thermoleophilaceae bacterium]|jgi:diguanylate cyclase (GGDEF)-like protein|nr:diguanylate cyclase [Thermoleophilaceae bacterium]
MACVYVAAGKSGHELRGAYRDSAQATLQAAAKGFEARYRAASSTPRELVRELMTSHPELQSAAIYTRGRDRPTASAGHSPAAGPDTERLLTPLTRGGGATAALALTYDMRPAQRMLDERNQRVLVGLGILAAVALAFVILLLARGIFRPLDRLRFAAKAVGEGDLGTRLGWRRTDELGQLAREFDTMAAHLEEQRHGLQELAHRDPLTELCNHRRFQEELAEELDRARDSGRPFALVLLDIDDFKRINDARGHPYGDELLGAAAAGLRSAMRGLGVVARVGGDEFGLILPDTDGPRAFALAEAARTAVELSAPVRGTLRCSAGVACYPDDAKSAATLLELASGALRWAKESGRGRARRYDPERVFVVTEEQREDFAALIGRPDVVRPVFQPIVSLASGEPVGYEALARFEGKPGLPPSWWFAQAHRFGLGAALEAQSVRAALAAEDRPPGTFLSINLSPSALARAEARECLPGDMRGLVVEITEEERVFDVEGLQRHLDPLRARGARIAVDDAGEGYAGLQQLMSMRADIIKLDRALVADVHADPAKVALIGSLVQFARSTGAAICAEGIETLDELRVLIHLGVAYGQGWTLGRPGAPWPRVNAEAARLCRDLRSARAKIVPLAAAAELRRGA